MSDKQQSFMDYWLEVDAALLKMFGIDSSDSGLDPNDLAAAQETGCSPEEFAHWYGDKYDLCYLEDAPPPCSNIHSVTTNQKIAALNDLCRKAMGIAGRLVQTSGICALPPAEQSAIREKVERYNAPILVSGLAMEAVGRMERECDLDQTRRPRVFEPGLHLHQNTEEASGLLRS